MHFVYILSDPRTDVVAYVGITNNAYTRFLAHLKCHGENGQKDAWIQQLQDEKVVPCMKIIETVETATEARKREDYWIRYYLDQGIILHNIRIDGIVPRKPRPPKPPKVETTKEKKVYVAAKSPTQKKRVVTHTRLKFLRQERGLSRGELATLSNVSNQTIVNIERYGKEPIINTVRKLSKALGISTEEFFTDDPSQVDGTNEEERPAVKKLAAA